MQKKFFSSLALMIILNLLIKPIAIFGIDTAVQNRVGPESYGIFFTLLNFSMLFNIILDLGINNYTTKNIAQYPEITSKYLGRILTFRIILLPIYVLFTFGIAILLQWNAYELYLLSFLVANQFIIILIAYIRSHLSGILRFKEEAILGVLDRFLLILICGSILYLPIVSGPFQIEWFIWSQTIAYGLSLIVGIYFFLRHFDKPKLKYNRIFSYAILKKSLPYALLILLMSLYTRFDSIMIERIHISGKREAGFYAQGFRLLNVFVMFAMMFSSLLFPMFSQMLRKKLSVVPLLNTTSKLLIGGAITLSIIVLFNSEYILNLIYNEGVQETKDLFILLMFSFISMCITIIYGTYLTAKGDLIFLNSISAIGILVNIIINFLLIPTYGAYGASVATLATQSVVALVQMGYSVRSIHVKLKTVTLLQFLGLIISVSVMTYFYRAHSVLSFILILLGSLSGLFLFRIIDIQSIKKSFQQETIK